MFGTDFFNNALLIFTRFGQDQRSIYNRENVSRMTEAKIIREYRQQFERIYSFTPEERQFCFIDNISPSDPIYDAHERQSFQNAISQIKEFTMHQKPYFCKDIKAVLKEKDRLLKELQDTEKQREEDKEKFI